MIRNRKSLLALLPATLALMAPTLVATPAMAQAPKHHKSFVQRHPTLTGIGAGIATHHALKVAARNAKLHHKKLNFAERHPTLSAIGVGGVTRHEIKKHTPHN